MKKEIEILELFSGIGGFSLGFQEAGYKIKKHSFSEIDKHAIANYKYNFKDAKSIGSVTNIREYRTRPDIITFGSPCQDFSMAGKRAGMEGQKSSLIREAIRIIDEVRPSVFIWENVKGAFSSNNGEDFWAIIAAFTNLGGYRLEFQLLNTSWFLPQNRERIYLVGHLADRSRPGVFPITENDRLFEQQKEANQRRTQATNSRTINRNCMRADNTFIDVQKNAYCLTNGGNSGGLHSDMTTIKVKQLNNLGNFGTKSTKQQDRVYSPNGLMACLSSHRLEMKCNILVPHITRTDEAKAQRKENRAANGKDHTPFQGKKIEWKPSDAMNTITCQTQKDNLLSVENKIRRLTEIECERLQGFPDDWTKFGNYDGVIKEIPKTARYKLLGNAVTVAVVKAIALRLKLIN